MASEREELIRQLRELDADPGLDLGGDKDPGQMSREEMLAELRGEKPQESLSRALFPSTSAAADRGAGLGGKAAGVLSDVASGILRVPAALGRTLDTQMGLSGDGPQSFRESLGQINRGEDARGDSSLISKMTKDPATVAAAATAPISGPLALGARGARFLPALTRLAGAGALEGAASGAAHSVDQFAREGAVDPATIPTEAAVGGALGPVAGGLGWALGQGARGVRALGRGVQETLPQLPPGGASAAVPSQVTRQGLTLTPSQVANERTGLRPAIEQFAQTNPFVNDIPGEIAERNAQAVPAAVLRERGRILSPPAGLGDITPSATGGRIDEAARTAREGLGQRFAQGQDEALRQSGVGGMDLPTHYEPKRIPAGQPGAGRMMKNQVQDVVADIDAYMADAGFDRARGFTGQENGLSKQAFDFVEKQKELIRNATTTQDLLNQKRRIAREIYDGSTGEAPLFRDRDVAFLEGFERRINDNIERQFELAFGAEPGQISFEAARAAGNLWRATNQSYAANRRILESVDRGLGVSSAKTNVEQYFNRIQNIGAENLTALRQASEQSAELRPLFQELQSGFFDNFLKKATSKAPDGTLTISPEKLITEWRGMDMGLKRALVPEGVIGEMDELVEVVGRSRLNQANLTNPSGTARLTSLTQAIKNPTEWIQGLLLRGPVREYYRSGNIMPAESILNVLHRAGRATEATGRGLEGGLRVGRTLGGNGLSRQGIRSSLSGGYEE